MQRVDQMRLVGRRGHHNLDCVAELRRLLPKPAAHRGGSAPVDLPEQALAASGGGRSGSHPAPTPSWAPAARAGRARRRSAPGSPSATTPRNWSRPRPGRGRPRPPRQPRCAAEPWSAPAPLAPQQHRCRPTTRQIQPPGTHPPPRRVPTLPTLRPPRRVRIGREQPHDPHPQPRERDTLHRQPGQPQQTRRTPTTAIHGPWLSSRCLVITATITASRATLTQARRTTQPGQDRRAVNLIFAPSSLTLVIHDGQR